MTSLGRALLLLITVLSSAAPAMAQNIPPPTQNVWVTANPNSPIPVVPSGGSGGLTVNLGFVNGIPVLTGAGATGTGSERITVGQDTTTVAGSASGTAGTPSANVVSIQGVSGGTALPVTTTPVAITPVAASSSLESSHILKGSGGNFFGVQVNTTSASEWVMLFNATTAPSDGAVTPVAWWQVNASSTLSVSEMPGLALSTGIVIVCSTTGPFTKTASALCTFGAGIVQ